MADTKWFRVDISVRPRAGVRDPQGDAVQEALKGVGYTNLQVHGVGRTLRLDIAAPAESEAATLVHDMCKRLLVNPNLETYDIAISAL